MVASYLLHRASVGTVDLALYALHHSFAVVSGVSVSLRREIAVFVVSS